jgi:hypothetical protein
MWIQDCFKGAMTRDFRPLVFSSTPPRLLIHELKPFCVWLGIHGEDWKNWLHSGVIATTLLNIFAKMIQKTFLCWNLTQLHTCTAVSLTPLWHAQRCQCHCCDFGPHIREALTTFKGNIYQKTYIDWLSYTISIAFTIN